ncbi:MAG: hypothetical protein HKN31_08315 [Pricia sp.]|nr:hypothetical protein [Pricia sp.]
MIKQLCIHILFSAVVSYGQAQTLSTKETKVVLIVDYHSETVRQIVLFGNLEKMDSRVRRVSYPDCKFYVGLLSGTYTMVDDFIIPKYGTTVIIYTEKQIFLAEGNTSSDDFSPGNTVQLGKAKAKVVSRKKGELILKI